MATANPFDLLGDGDNDDVVALVKTAPVAKEKHAAKKPSNVHVQAAASGKLPVKPLSPSQAVREARASQSEGTRGRGGSGRGGRSNRDQEFGRGRGGNFNGDSGFNRESYDGYGGRGGFYEGNASFRPRRQEDGEVDSGERGRGGGGSRGGGRGGRGGRGYGGGRGFGGDAGDEDHRKRIYDRRSGTGRGSEMKREGSGRGNWGTPVDEGDFQEMEEPTSAEEEKILTLEKAEGENNVEVPPVNEEKKQEEEDEKEMTLDEYEKLLEEKRKKLLGGQKVEERKVDATAFESMKQLSIKKKKDEDAVFIKVSEKDKEKKIDAGERDDRIKKPISINEFLKPAEGERYYGGGRGRGRGRGNRGGFTGGFGGGDNALQSEAPKIEDHGQFPTLGGK